MTTDQAKSLPVNAPVRRPIVQWARTMAPITLPGWQFGRVRSAWPNLTVVFDGESAPEALSDQGIKDLEAAGPYVPRTAKEGQE